MKKLMTLMFFFLMVTSVLTGCSGNDNSYEKKTYLSKDVQISQIYIDVRDRQVEVIPSSDEQIRIDYYENSKEYYNISVSEENALVMTPVYKKDWTDFIGGKASADVRKIIIQVPKTLLDVLSISTTNEDISIVPLTIQKAMLKTNGGNIFFEQLNVGNEMILDIKNGNISGILSGSFDDYAISCTIKKGKTNLPSDKDNGSKKLSVTANNGDVMIDIN